MSIKRIAIAGIIAAALTLTACTGTGNPNPTASPSNTPTPTSTAGTKVPPPASEDEAIAAADSVLTEYLVARGEVNAAGGTDTSSLEVLATGKALDVAVRDAAYVAEGPVLNVDQVNVEGPATTEGAIKYETLSAYGQPWEDVENGLVTINACQDASEYKVFASDGSEALRPDARTTFDYQVIYDSERQTWLVYDLISLGESC
ncbi:hypothetical protein ACF044_16105 [Microbacterium sp. NPDC016588]|nr:MULTISPECIES: hypothetical protein [unclassified Microbacterium]OAN39404.1 hypothetical protein A4X16_14855 [Microbacterium sp. H83]TCJ21489.1 hypothetical protein E0W80_16510 [Microbacterium sp. PI-1]